MKVSVVIPVYNCESFLREAVESALAQPETDEVLLVWDASPDNALTVCNELAAESPKVRALKHPNGGHHGAGASRNLGILEAKNEWISFLDADDFFLPGRFDCLVRTLADDSSIDGICEAVGTHFETDAARQRWKAQKRPMLTTLEQEWSPEELFEHQDPVGNGGYCQTSGWIVRKEALVRAGMFDEDMERNEDLLLFAKLAGSDRIQPGRIKEPVAMRRVHERNLTSDQWDAKRAFLNRLKLWKNLHAYGKNNFTGMRNRLLVRRIVEFNFNPWLRNSHWFSVHIAPLKQVLCLGLSIPGCLLVVTFWQHLLRSLFAPVQALVKYACLKLTKKDRKQMGDSLI